MTDDVTTFETSIEMVFEREADHRPIRMDVVPAGRVHRRWAPEAKARIIASTFEPGANVAQIARMHEMAPQQLYAWRRARTQDRDRTSEALGFVPAVVAEAESCEPDVTRLPIVIRTDGFAIDVPATAGTDHIARVLTAVKQSG